MEGLGINLGYVIVQVITFLAMVIILRAWVFKPMLNMLEKRRKTIAQGLEDARVASDARANAEKDAQEIIAKAQQEANAKVREATERAEQAARELQAAAERDVTKIREDAKLEAEQSKSSILGELRGQVAALAIAAAQKIIGETLDQKHQRELIDEFFSGIKSGKVVLIEAEEVLPGGSAEVISALPLTTNEQEIVKQDVLSKIGGSATVSFREDPDILGGLIIRVGDKVLDGSVAAKLEGLRQSIR
ncbi:MAG: F0F1 ATP synthase subunit B [Anaerolineales bacterium]